MSIARGEAGALSLLAAVADPAIIVDPAACVVAWNPAAQALLELPDDAAGRSLDDVVGSRAGGARRAALAEPPGAALLVWAQGDNRPGPDDIALQKLDAIGRIAGGMRHDVMSPLGAVMGFADLQAEDPRMPADLRESARDVHEAGQRVQLMVQAMLELSRDVPPKPAPLALGPLVRDLMTLLAHPTIDMQCRIAVPDELPEVEADRGQIRQALLAVLINALEAQGTSWASGVRSVPGRLAVSGYLIDDPRGDRVRLLIEDGGPVVPADERPMLFGGSGTGRAGRDLAVARELVERAGGSVAYEEVAGGNRIAVELPVAQEAGRPQVLVCGAEPLIRTLLVRFTARHGVECLEARNVREALATLSDRPVSMVIADLAVEAGAFDLYSQSVSLRPELATRFVFVSGDPGSLQMAEFARRTGVLVMPKPFDQGRLDKFIRDASGR
ncbi:MAG: sensor histidine kinase [Candidatus Limnocylindrales bacterium]